MPNHAPASKTLTIHFDVLHLYYLPQYLPVAKALETAGHQAIFVIYEEQDLQACKKKIVIDEGLSAIWVNNDLEAYEYYAEHAQDWIVFGNVPSFKTQNMRKIQAKLALMLHGIGPKACYYESSEFKFDVRFVEGETKLRRLEALFPKERFIEVGYAKLDPFFKPSLQSSNFVISLDTLGLDKNKKTLLYAPTFFPSSIECLPANWPDQLSEYNIIIKPHFFSLIKSNYAKQRKLLSKWEAYPNVYLAGVENYSLLPYMALADLLLSEASSSMFEFICLDKPVVWCNFFHKRWGYRGIFSFRMKQRLDDDMSLFEEISTRADSAKMLPVAIKAELNDSQRLAQNRAKVAKSMAGKTDGLCSQRIVEYLEASQIEGASA